MKHWLNTMLAAFKALLYGYTSNDDVVTSVSDANRDQPEIAGLIGFFANMLILRTALSGNPTFRELLRRLRDVFFETCNYRLPIKMFFAQKIDYGQVLFNFMKIPMDVSNFSPGLQVIPMDVLSLEGDREMYQNISLIICDYGDKIRGSLSYTTSLFDSETIQHLVNSYGNMLEQIVKQPEVPCFDLTKELKSSFHTSK